MANVAFNATRIWTTPSLYDEEGVQTRYGTYPMVHLLLLREMVRVDSNSVRLWLLNGGTPVAQDRDWNLDTARGIHRNLVRVPRWAIAEHLGNVA